MTFFFLEDTYIISIPTVERKNRRDDFRRRRSFNKSPHFDEIRLEILKVPKLDAQKNVSCREKNELESITSGGVCN